MIDFKSLAIQTLKDPARAADRVLALGLDPATIWAGFALNVVLSALLYGIQAASLGLAGNALFPGLSPMIFALFLAGLQLSYAWASILSARWLGGQAPLLQVLSLLVWLRFLNIAAQAVAIVLAFLSPPVALLFNVAAAFYGLYVLAHFTNVAFGLNSLVKSSGVIVMAGLGAMAAVLLMMGLLIPTILETSHV